MEQALRQTLTVLLGKLSVIKHKYEVLKEAEEQFNIFTALYKQRDEVRLHSRFLSVLLSPTGSHKKKDLFLKKFLAKTGVNNLNPEHCVVYPDEWTKKEYKNMDILIIDYTNRSAILTENKIDAHDSNHEDRGQLEGYVNLLIKEENIPLENIRVFYLSPDGREPSPGDLSKSGSNECNLY
ncbi:MAG: PD-(D/E)XK nuclease family protein [Tannerellaceae bacterium]|nr:PD-(D/E)XK nuclease family protein [Tannerellaceae bacterium]